MSFTNTPFTIKRLTSFTRDSKPSYGPGSKVVTVSLHRCSSQSRRQTRRASNTSSKLRGCLKLVKSGVSAILIVPMPYFKAESRTDKSLRPAPEDSESGSLKRILSRRPQQADGKRRNSLVLPEVPMPDAPVEPESLHVRRPSECTIRESPPPMEDRTVRFVTPPPKFAPPKECNSADEEPAWCDFMVSTMILPGDRGN
ncbi:hypothetical protein DFH06DRAFT_1147144 [Mycena polygramma]|nr:hypothetical protein DFH06DRAFT_1147144 [Mycena polygramma]